MFNNNSGGSISYQLNESTDCQKHLEHYKQNVNILGDLRNVGMIKLLRSVGMIIVETVMGLSNNKDISYVKDSVYT